MNDQEIKSLVYEHLTSVAPEAARLYKVATKAHQLSSQMPKLEDILSSPVVKHSCFVVSFPDCVVAEIFSNLNLKQRIAVQRVCKQWDSLATTNVESVEFYGVTKFSCSDQMAAYKIVEKTAIVVRNWREVYWVIKKCKQLKRVKFSECNFTMGNDFLNVCDLLRELESIQIYYCNFYTSGENIEKMLKHCCNLRELAVNHNPYGPQTIIPLRVKFLRSILLRNQHLNSLCLQIIPNLKNCNFVLPALKKLDLFSFERDHDHLLYFLQNVLNRSEESLEILYTPPINDEHLRIISRFKNLKDLRIKHIEDNTFWSESFPFQKLEILKLHHDEEFDTEQLVNVIRKNRGLRVLDLDGLDLFNDWVIEQIVDHCNDLQTLILRSFPKSRNDKLLLKLLKLPKLEMLYFDPGPCEFNLNALNTLINNHSSLRVVSCPTNYANDFLQNVVEVKQLMPNYSTKKTYFLYCNAKEIRETVPNNIFLLGNINYGSVFSFYFKYMFYDNRFCIDYFDWKKIPILNRKPKGLCSQ